MAATLDVGTGVDSFHLDRPHPAAIERTLPGRVHTEWGRDTWFGVFIDALEVRDDLHEVSEETRKEGGFGAGGGVPGSATSAGWQASIALAAEGVADQICRVSRRHGNIVRSGRRRDLRRRKGNCAECTYEQQSGSEKAPNSSSLCCLL